MKKVCRIETSVADPEPDLSDPYVFGPPGSGSISQRYRYGTDPEPNPSIIKQKIVRKTLIFSTVL
jgi:hypothetical protein